MQDDCDAARVLLKTFDLAIIFEPHQVAVLTGAKQDRVNVGAMTHRIGMTEPGMERLGIERNAGDPLAGKRTPHFHGRRAMGIREHRLLETDRIKRTKDVGTELNAGAELLELG